MDESSTLTGIQRSLAGGRTAGGLDVAVTKIAIDLQNLGHDDADASLQRCLDSLLEAVSCDAVCIALTADDAHGDSAHIERIFVAQSTFTAVNPRPLEGKSLEYVLAVSPLIWGARTPLGEWPLHVKDAVNSIGMDYDAIIADIQKNPDKYDAVWDKNAFEHAMTGQGGVPTMSFNGEPFFGQDRFNQVFWRLRENGLTVRKEARAPFIAKPLRWPDSN